jgi:hypothetical protein
MFQPTLFLVVYVKVLFCDGGLAHVTAEWRLMRVQSGPHRRDFGLAGPDRCQ